MSLLIFTNNCELLSSIGVEDWSSFTDHRLVTAWTNYQFKQEDQIRDQQFLCDTGKRYSALNFHLAPWSEVKAKISSINWEKMEELAKTCPSSALVEFHERLLEVLEKLVTIKKKGPKGTRPKIHRLRRLLWKKHAKAKKKFQSSTSTGKFSENLQSMWELEQQLSQDYSATSNMEENEAVMRIKSNTKAFFSFARSRQKVRAKIGPFLDPSTGSPNPSPDFAAESLKTQYDSVFSVPRPAWTVSNPSEHFKIVEGDGSLNDFTFSPEDIERACSELNSTSAPGPDGVPANLLKTCRTELSQPLYLLWRSSLDSGNIPAELLLVLVSPIHKGGSRAAPKNYRPVALTSHLIKVFERVLRRVLVKFIERQGLLPDGQHGSRAMRSTLTQLLSHWESILDGLETGEGVDAVYLDFSKAFDKVETGVLLHKL